MDNLNFHKSQIVQNLIHTNGHQFVFRAPYWSCDGAIEYVFNRTAAIGAHERQLFIELRAHVVSLRIYIRC